MSEKLKICWIIPTLDQGGAEKQLTLLAAGIDRERFEPHVITLTRLGPRYADLQAANVHVVDIQKRGKLDWTAYRRLSSAIKDIAPHVVHTWLFAANSYGRYAALNAKVPVIFGGERCVDPWKRTTHGFIDRYLARKTDGIISNSSAIVEFYVSRGIEADKFHVIPNGIAPRTTQSITREEAAKRMNIDPSRTIVAAVGRLWPQKGYKDMIWASEMLRVASDKTSFIIIGDGPQRQRLEHYRDQVRAAKEIRFLGHRDDVALLMPHFNCLWNASLYEGQSNTILEAMQCGVPVVASDIPGNRDLIQHEKTGMLFPVGQIAPLIQATMALLESDPFRANIIQAAKDRIENDFSIEKMVERHERLYWDSVKSKGIAL